VMFSVPFVCLSAYFSGISEKLLADFCEIWETRRFWDRVDEILN